MSTDRPTRDEFLQLIQKAVASSMSQGELLSLPHLFVPNEWLRWEDWEGKRLRVEDAVLHWLISYGLDGDRARKDFYGYPGLFSELNSPPPWIDIAIEDTEGPVSHDRAKEIEPLYLQAHRDTHLEARFAEYSQDRITILSSWASRTGKGMGEHEQFISLAQQLDIDEFRRLLGLARTLGVKVFDDLFQAIFEHDDLYLTEGTPDLFLWQSGSTPPLWFFAEVKGPSDHIRPSQYRWLKTYWERIRGHFILVSVLSETAA